MMSEAPSPRIHPNAHVAPEASVCGDVAIGSGARVMCGARLFAEPGGSIVIGENTIVLENAVIRATVRQSCRIGDHCMIGPNSHVVGATIEDEVFVATGAAIFHGARLETGSEVRINGVVHLRSRLAAGATVPIGWVAVGDPAQILPPDRHEQIWALQQPLDFPGFVYGADRTAPHPMRAMMKAMSERLWPPTPS